MKNTLYVLTGKRYCDIYRHKTFELFDLIKDRIEVREFASAKEMRAFKENIKAEMADEDDYILLTEKHVVFIMEHAPSNQEYVEPKKSKRGK
ncbi:hypothetical protein FBQ82_09465 [Anaerolineae bacterium CFX7]|nr:hypothetical protein [Anaerolineae bacterium CFX7]